MRKIFIYENGVNFVFEIDKNSRARLLCLSNASFDEYKFAAEYCFDGIEISGKDISNRLKFLRFKDTGNQQGRKLEITLNDEQSELEAVFHFQFYNNVSAVKGWVTIVSQGNEDIIFPYALESFLNTLL